MRADGTPYPGLPAAIARVRDAYPDRPDVQALAWALLPRLPGKPRTSGNLKREGARSALAPLEDIVLSDPWLAMNTESAVNMLWAESDKSGLAERLALMREWGVPVQAWTACGSRGGHAAFIVKEPVVTGYPGQEEADRGRLRKLSLVHSYLVTAIDGDRSAGLRGMTKNPFSSRWAVEVGNLTPVTLDEVLVPLQAMAEALGWKAPKRRFRGDRKREPSPEGRNCHLFDLTRWWAGDGCVKDGAAILDFAMDVNAGFAIPLGFGEVACVARSITRFMVNRYDGRGRHVPMAAATVRVCQAAAGRRTSSARAASRDERLLFALDRLQARGIALGQQDVAAEAGVSLSTVKAVWGMLWDRIVNNSQNAPPASGNSILLTHEAVPASPPEAQLLALDASHAMDEETLPPDQAMSCGRGSPEAPSWPVWDRTGRNRQVDGEARRAGLKAIDVLVHRVEAAERRAAIRACPQADPAAFLAEVAAAARREALADPWSPESLARRRRQLSKVRCEKREADHEAAAQGGLRAYRDTVAGRFASLFRERKAALDAVMLDPEEGADPGVVEAARERVQEQVKVICMASAAKARAETRISRRWDDELQVRERGRLRPFRTHLDAVDRIAAAVTPMPERVAAGAVREPSGSRQPVASHS